MLFAIERRRARTSPRRQQTGLQADRQPEQTADNGHVTVPNAMKVRTGAGSKDDEHTKAPRERPIRNFGQSERGRSPVQRATSCASSARASWCEPVSYCHFHSVARAILSLLERVKRPTEPSPPPPCPLATAGGAGGAGRTPQAIGGAQRCRANVPGCDGTSAAVVITVSIPIRLFMPAIIIGDHRGICIPEDGCARFRQAILCDRPFRKTPGGASQSDSQLFHGPAPRSPLHRLAVRLRHSRSNY